MLPHAHEIIPIAVERTLDSLIGRREATRFEIKHLVSRFFGDSHELLIMNILEDSSIDEEELKRLRKLLEEGQQ